MKEQLRNYEFITSSESAEILLARAVYKTDNRVVAVQSALNDDAYTGTQHFHTYSDKNERDSPLNE